MSNLGPPRHEIARPLAKVYDPANNNAPLAALLSALKSVSQPASAQSTPPNKGSNDAQFTAQLCSALSLRPDSLFSNFQRKPDALSIPAALPVSTANLSTEKLLGLLPQEVKQDEGATDHSSAVACNSLAVVNQQIHGDRDEDDDEEPDELEGQGTQDTSSAEHLADSSISLCKLKGESLTEEAKKRRRQEINRESARRVRKRKSLEHQQLQHRVANLQSAASSAAADQAVIVRYASELARERDALLQRAADLESKWIAAECRNLVLRQHVADVKGVPLNAVSADTGQLVTSAAPKAGKEQ